MLEEERLGAAVFGGSAIEVFGWPKEPVEGDDDEVDDVGVESSHFGVLNPTGLGERSEDGEVGRVGAS